MQASSFFIGPQHTPKAVKWVIWITVALSLLSPILTFFLQHYLKLLGPGVWLSLSLFGLKSAWYWQPLSYVFIQTAQAGLTLSLLISLFFNMLILWFTSSEIAARFGSKGFLLFFFGAALFAGLISSSLLLFFSSPSLIVGCGPVIYALVMVWAMIFPELELFFFFLIRIKVKWLALIFLLFSLLTNLSYGQFIPFFADLSGIVWGFAIGSLVWKLKNPFPLNLALPKRTKKQKKESADKIIDISVFRESDDAFMDRMLDKINKGEPVSTRERERMQNISKKKNRDN